MIGVTTDSLAEKAAEVGVKGEREKSDICKTSSKATFDYWARNTLSGSEQREYTDWDRGRKTAGAAACFWL